MSHLEKHCAENFTSADARMQFISFWAVWQADSWTIYLHSEIQGHTTKTKQSLEGQERQTRDTKEMMLVKCIVAYEGLGLYSPVWQAPPSHPSGQLQIPGATQIPPFLQPWGQIAAQGTNHTETFSACQETTELQLWDFRDNIIWMS